MLEPEHRHYMEVFAANKVELIASLPDYNLERTDRQRGVGTFEGVIQTIRKLNQKSFGMPDRLIDLFIQICLQDNGRLSAKKKESHFGFLTDDELARMENSVLSEYKKE